MAKKKTDKDWEKWRASLNAQPLNKRLVVPLKKHEKEALEALAFKEALSVSKIVRVALGNYFYENFPELEYLIPSVDEK